MRMDVLFSEQENRFDAGMQEEEEHLRVGFGDAQTVTERDYNALNNKPSINNVELMGDKTTEDLGLGTYSKPSGGIPGEDLAEAVQTSLGKADTAYQAPDGGIPSSDMDSTVQSSLGKADSAYQLPAGGIPATDLADKYAGAAVAGGVADGTQSIPYGEVDSTSTSTVFTATVPGITKLEHGTVMLLKNGVVTSASGFTININNLGAKPAYNNMAAASAETTLFNVNYTMLFIYDENRVTGGCWVCYRGYNSDTNTIGYQIRTNSTVMKTADQSRYYRMFFTSADGTHMVPANTAKDNSATSKKTVNQRPIDPFGRIIYYSYTTNLSAESDLGASYCWEQYTFSLGYSFNTTGSALTMTAKTPVYIKCTPQADGSAIIDSTTPYVQALPTTNDGKIYIFLGIAYSATNIELQLKHPVYYHNGTGIRLWTGGT